MPGILFGLVNLMKSQVVVVDLKEWSVLNQLKRLLQDEVTEFISRREEIE